MDAFQQAQQMIQQNNAWSAQQAQKQMDFQERMSNTAHVREIEDLKAAGLNPILSAKLGGASTPSGAMGDTDTSGTSVLIDALLSSIHAAGSAASAAANATEGMTDRLDENYNLPEHYIDRVMVGDDAKTAALNSAKGITSFGDFASNVIGLFNTKAGNAVRKFFKGKEEQFADYLYNNPGYRWMYDNRDKMRAKDDEINNAWNNAVTNAKQYVSNEWNESINWIRKILTGFTHHSGKF